MVTRVTGEREVLANLNRRITGIKGKTLAGLLTAGLFIEREAAPLVPVDTGNLRGSSYTRKAGPMLVEIGYTAAYAVYVHENLEAHHPVGQAKFLTTPLIENEDKVVKIIENEARV